MQDKNITNYMLIYSNKKRPPKRSFKIWDGRIRTSEMPGPKPGALPLGDVPSSTPIYY